MSQLPSILVLGAGELGTAVLGGFIKHPKRHGSFTVLLRDSTINTRDLGKKKQNADLRSLGIKFEPGDIERSSVSELADIFKRYDTAILEAGVRRYFPWQYGIDYDAIGAGSAQDLFDEQLEVRTLLRGQTETYWVIVSTGLFMSFLLLPEFGPVNLRNLVARGLGSWDTQVCVTTPKDIGMMVAEIVFEPRDKSHQVVFVAGDTVTYGQVADLVERRFGSPFKREVWDLEFLRKRLAEQPDNVMFKYQNVFAAGRGVAWDMTKTVNGQRDIAMENFEAYLNNIDIKTFRGMNLGDLETYRGIVALSIVALSIPMSHCAILSRICRAVDEISYGDYLMAGRCFS